MTIDNSANDLEQSSKEKAGEIISIYRRKPQHLDEVSADDKFDVIVPKKNKVALVLIFLILFFAQFYYFSGMYVQQMYPETYDPSYFFWWVPLVFLVLSIVPILAWGELGARMGAGKILKWLHKTVLKRKPRADEFLVGFPLATRDIYYLEAYPQDLDLGSDFAHLKVFISRVLEILFLSMGLSVVISQLVVPYIYPSVIADDPDMYWNIHEMIIDTTIYLGPFTLLILFAIMPMFWISEDMQVYRINEYQDSIRLGFYLRNGIMSKILGFFGLVLVYNLAEEFGMALFLDQNPQILTDYGEIDYAILMSSPGLAIEMYRTIFIWFGLIILMSAAVPFLVSLIYLSVYHQRWVNNVRIRASEFIQLGTLLIRKPRTEFLKYMNHPEMIDETEGFFQTKNGKILLISLIIIAAMISFYIAFILGF